MPVPFFFHIVEAGIDSVPILWPVLKTLPWLGLFYVLKTYFGGVVNKSERVMHGKVIMVTGGTSGIGAAIVEDLASRGAQIILLSQHAASDPFLQEFIDDLRERSKNELIYAETVNLASLYSIRRFATRWVDNAPPRRLDMIILCANTFETRFGHNEKTVDGLDPCWGLNYLANFHLLSILSPALRAQPPDRDVRIVAATCGSYVGGDLKHMRDSFDPLPGKLKYETSKLALMTFMQAFQKHLDAYQRPDKMPMNSRVILVDPGWVRTPGMRRWLSMGSLWGLLLYLLLWPIYWLVLKDVTQGAQSFLTAAMEAEYGRGIGGRFIRECRDWSYKRPEINNETAQKELWEFSEKQVTALEQEGSRRRAELKQKAGPDQSEKGQGEKKEPAGNTQSGVSKRDETLANVSRRKG